jgi:hypothetical protein
MYGLTHALDGSLIIREPKILKVGIGLPKGKAISVWIAPDKKWRVTYGYKKDEQKTASVGTRAEAEAMYRQYLPSAPICPYPRKTTFFMFSKPSIEDGREQFVPDFDAIEAHGPMPTEIDIVLLEDSPFAGAYQMWSASELRCKGDGVNAMRLVAMATAAEKEAATEATAAGEKYFPIAGCWTGGCQYAVETTVNGKVQPSMCKPGGDLKFQLACNIRVGGTAYFHTTGYRSISSIFSSLHRIATLTGGRLAGIPLKMCLRPFRTNHNGQAATHYAVALEFRAPDPATLSRKLMESVWEFKAPPPAVRMIEASEAEDSTPIISAEAMAAEFYPDADDEETEAAPPPAAQVKTEQKTVGLADKMAARKRKADDVPVTETITVPNPAAVTSTDEDAF